MTSPWGSWDTVSPLSCEYRLLLISSGSMTRFLGLSPSKTGSGSGTTLKGITQAPFIWCQWILLEPRDSLLLDSLYSWWEKLSSPPVREEMRKNSKMCGSWLVSKCPDPKLLYCSLSSQLSTVTSMLTALSQHVLQGHQGRDLVPLHLTISSYVLTPHACIHIHAMRVLTFMTIHVFLSL